jgi:hypothetical protein
MNALKTFLVWFFLGALLGVIAASLVAPGMLAWNNTPGEGQALCDCVKVTRSTSTDLIKAQLISGIVGAVLFLGLGALLSRRRKAPDGPTSPTTAGPAASG